MCSVATRAAADGTSPEETTRSFGARNHVSLEGLGCELAHFLRPVEDKPYQAEVQAFFRRLVARGGLELREAEHLHCPSCDR